MTKLLILLLLSSLVYSWQVENDIKRNYIFPEWEKLNKLNKEHLHSHDHDAMVHIYTNDIATAAYKEKKKSFPEHSLIVKPLYNEQNLSRIIRLVIMIKMHKGYDTPNNDWWYGVYDKTGMSAWYEGKIQSCIKCHEIAKKTDYMFSETVMEAIHFQD